MTQVEGTFLHDIKRQSNTYNFFFLTELSANFCHTFDESCWIFHWWQDIYIAFYGFHELFEKYTGIMNILSPRKFLTLISL